MQVTETKEEGLNRDYNIVLPSKDIDKKVKTRLVEVGRTVSLAGFRKGKVPLPYLRKRFGDSVRGEVLEKTLQETVENLIKEKKYRPASQPKLDLISFEEGKDVEFTVGIELLPEIEPIDFSTISIERPYVEIEDEEVEKALGRIAENHKDSETVGGSRKSKKGDIAVINFVGSIDGKEFDGGKGDDYPLELGSGSFIPGFEEQVIGAKAGEKLDVKVPFPKDYHAKDLAGKEAVFAVTVKELRQTTAVKLDDEFAKKLGKENIGEVRTLIHDDIKKEYDSVSRMKMKRELLDVLADKHEFAVPESMVTAEFDAIWKQVEEMKKAGKSDPEDEGKTDKELKADYRKIAERRVCLGLLLAEVGRKNNLEVSEEDIRNAVLEEAKRYPGQEMAVFQYYGQNKSAMESLRAPLFEDKVVDFVLELAKFKDKKVSLEDLYAEPEIPVKKAKKAAAKKTTAKKATPKKAPAKKAVAKETKAKKS